MIGRVAIGVFQDLCATQVEMKAELPGEADAAVNLNAFVADEAGGVAAEAFAIDTALARSGASSAKAHAA